MSVGVVAIVAILDVHDAIRTHHHIVVRALPSSALFINRFAGFLSTGFVCVHGCWGTRQPASGARTPGAFLPKNAPEDTGCLHLLLRTNTI